LALNVGFQHLTVLFLGTKKLDPVVVGRWRQIHRRIGARLPLSYFTSPNANVTGQIFSKWLSNLDDVMVRQKRRICLLVDSLYGYKLMNELKAVRIVFLPSVGCRQSISIALKFNYRALLLHWLLNALRKRKSGAIFFFIIALFLMFTHHNCSRYLHFSIRCLSFY
uniref:DDE-1 domain-containing protein n=1 Tax=Soboliphyme baturini TaxID=241478 RepID=A0A183J8E4_9BILA